MKRLRSILLRQFYKWLTRWPWLGRVYVFRVRRRHLATKLSGTYADWETILGRNPEVWESRRQSARGGPKVLMATSVGGHLVGTTVESLLAAALTLRGVDIHVLLCDAALPACFQCKMVWYPRMQRFLRHGPSRDLCHLCFEPAARTFRALGIRIHRYSDFITADEHQTAATCAASVPVNDIASYKYDGIAR